jgi:hypothetical protein
MKPQLIHLLKGRYRIKTLMRVNIYKLTQMSGMMRDFEPTLKQYTLIMWGDIQIALKLTYRGTQGLVQEIILATTIGSTTRPISKSPAYPAGRRMNPALYL